MDGGAVCLKPMQLRAIAPLTLIIVAASAASTAGQKPPEASARAVNITVGDPVDGKMTYSVSRITAKPGERLRVTLTSIGTLPKAVMAHNWVLLRLGVDAKSFSDDAALARDTDFIPPKRKTQVIAYTGLIGPGEREEITFTVPKVAGKYPYVCTFAGHYAAGMSGELLVK
jgi:azurin